MCKLTISTYDLMRRFSDERAARLYLEEKRWHGSPVCPYCGSKERISNRKNRDGYFRCYACRKDFTDRVGTIFERSHVPLDKWLYVIYLLVTARKGISSLQLSKEIGVRQATAWFMLQRLREACADSTSSNEVNLLSGVVEIDETYIGGKEANKHASKKLHAGRGAVGKAIVLGMKERKGRVRGKVIDSNNAETIQGEIRMQVRRDATLCTDEHAAYNNIKGYTHHVVNHSAKVYVDHMANTTNGIESVWAVLKRGFYGTYHQFSRKHLQLYVNEFTYRLNEGKCGRHTMDRIEALLKKTEGVRITYKKLIG